MIVPGLQDFLSRPPCHRTERQNAPKTFHDSDVTQANRPRPRECDGIH